MTEYEEFQQWLRLFGGRRPRDITLGSLESGLNAWWASIEREGVTNEEDRGPSRHIHCRQTRRGKPSFISPS